MITSISIQNLRCFPALDVEPFKQINLISGLNGVGKSSLLEAVWLHHGRHNPTVLWSSILLRLTSGMSELNPVTSLANKPGPIQIVATESEPTLTRETRVRFEATKSDALRLDLPLEPEPRSRAENGDELQPYEALLRAPVKDLTELAQEVIVTYQDGGEEAVILKGRVNLEQPGRLGIVFEGTQQLELTSSAILIPAGRRGVDQEIIDRYSRMVRDGLGHELINALKIVEPRLRNIEVLTERGAPRLWCDLGETKMLPIEQVGDGLSRLLCVFTSISRARDGVVLIDEIENGVHHTAMGHFWRNIASLANALNVQVFATTHSRECIQAAHDTFPDDQPTGFILQRLYRKDGSICSEPYEPEKLEAALDMSLEVR